MLAFVLGAPTVLHALICDERRKKNSFQQEIEMKNNCLFWDFIVFAVFWWQCAENLPREAQKYHLQNVYKQAAEIEEKQLRSQTREKLYLRRKFNNFQFSKISIMMLLIGKVCVPLPLLLSTFQSLSIKTPQGENSSRPIQYLHKRLPERRSSDVMFSETQDCGFFRLWNFSPASPQWCLNIYFSDFHSQLDRLVSIFSGRVFFLPIALSLCIFQRQLFNFLVLFRHLCLKMWQNREISQTWFSYFAFQISFPFIFK